MGRRPRNQSVDWHAVEADFRAGLYRSVRALSRAHGVSHTAIAKRAEAEGWTQDPTRTKRERVKAAMSGFPVGSIGESVETRLQEVVDQVTADQNLAAANARRILELANGYLHRAVIPGTHEAKEALNQVLQAEAEGRVLRPEEVPLVLIPRELRTLGMANLQAVQTIREVHGVGEGDGAGDMGLSKEDRDAIVSAAGLE